jgi:signal transduction histidine kinase
METPNGRDTRDRAGCAQATDRLDQLERRYERLAQVGTSVLALLSIGLAVMAISGKPPVVSARIATAMSVVAGAVLVVGVGYFLATMRSLRREIGKRRQPSRAERIELIRRVGELSAVLEASRELEAARNLKELGMTLAIESESLAAGDAALVVLRRSGVLTIAAATNAVDQDDVALAAQSQGWSSFLDDGGMPFLSTGRAAIREAFGDGPLADRYESAMEVPLVANGRTIGLVVVLRNAGSGSAFDAEGLQAVGLLADVASHLILLRRINAKMRRTNLRLVQSMAKLHRAQVQLVQSEKLRAVGELVSGVAHELNNPLTSLAGFAQLLTLGNHLESEQRKWVDEIQREASRCSVILQNLLGFARRSAVGRTASPTAAVVSETLALKSYDLRAANVVVRNQVPESLPAPALDRQELQQVLLNLINNAVAAMRGSKDRVLTITGAADEGAILIEVGDTGCGIPADHITRIFQPFFSTKPAGDSIGLGLTTCHKIVSACGGSISVRSTVGEGSTFTLRLPKARAPVPV